METRMFARCAATIILTFLSLYSGSVLAKEKTEGPCLPAGKVVGRGITMASVNPTCPPGMVAKACMCLCSSGVPDPKTKKCVDPSRQSGEGDCRKMRVVRSELQLFCEQ